MSVFRCQFLGVTSPVFFLLLLCQATPPSADSAQSLLTVQQLLQQGNRSEARRQLLQALKDFPSEPGFYNLMGVLEAQEGNYRAAESNFKQAIERAPGAPGAYLNLGRLYQENRSSDPDALKKGLETYGKLLKVQPDHIEANYQSALLLQIQGSFKASLDHLSRLPAAEQQRSQALAVRCANHVGLDEYPQAETAAEQLLASPELAEADVLAILPALEAKRRDSLQVLLLEGLSNRGLVSSDTLRRLALLYERGDQLDRARDTLEKVVARQGNSVSLLLDLARLANKQRDLKGALGYLAHARDLEPENAGIHFFFGMVCVDLDLGSEAHKSLSKAVSLEPDNPYYNYALGAVSLHRRDPSEAIPYFRKYCELKPDDRHGRFALGVAYFESADFQSARKAMESLVQYPETTAGAHYFLARLARQEDNLVEAVRLIELALKTNPNYADAYAELGLVRLRQKEHEAAETALQRALQIAPDHYLGNLNLLMLYRRTKDKREEAQAKRLEELKENLSEKARDFLRVIEARPY